MSHIVKKILKFVKKLFSMLKIKIFITNKQKYVICKNKNCEIKNNRFKGKTKILKNEETKIEKNEFE